TARRPDAMKPRYLILLALMNCFWAGSYSVFKALSPELDAASIVTLRYGVTGMVLLLCWPWLPGSMPRGRDLIRAVVMGILVFGASPRLQVTGVQMGNATDASVLMVFEPLIISIGAAFFLHEHIGMRRWTGFLLGLTGVVMMSEIWRPDFHWPGLASNALIVMSYFCEAPSSIMAKPLVQRAGLFKVLAVAIMAGTMVNLVLGGMPVIRAAGELSVRSWLLLAYLSLICTLAGYLLWFAVIRETQINAVALTVFIQPVVGTAIAMVWLGESLHWGQTWGCLVIVAGLMIGFSPQMRRANSKIPKI
ncbi:MAG TPA: DMT family transporter, partial [Candidatus Binatia bacterium]|nr:DMT family transporter [Candidatus Binatia bacterium]